MVFSINTFAIIAAFFTTIIAYYKWCFQYWKKRNLPYLEPTIPFGISPDPLFGKENWAIAIARCYKEMKKRGWKHGGFYLFASPKYLPLDLEYLKNIFTKDFQYFTDRGLYYHEKKDVLNAHLVNLPGPKWKVLRPKLNPPFSSSKIRIMFQTLADCQTHLLNKMKEECSKPVDIKEVASCFTTDVIGSCIFGLDCKSFESDDSPLRVWGKKVFTPTYSQHLKRVFGINFPKLANLFNFCITSPDVNQFFLKVVRDTVNFREKNNYTRNDFMQLLIELKNSTLENNHSEMSLNLESLAAQCFGFFTAGFETSSTLMSFGLYELARNPQIQQKVRDEVKTVLEKHNNQVTYESIKDMKYLNQVIDETLRMYPPIPLLHRRCVKDYKIPDEDIVIKEGTMVPVPILGIHYDEDYYPNPEKFDPDRFSEENKPLIPRYAYLPFGEGPRICIGKRFGLIQAKVGLSCLVKNFKFTVNHKTKQPLKMQASGTTLCTADEIWLDVVKV